MNALNILSLHSNLSHPVRQLTQNITFNTQLQFEYIGEEWKLQIIGGSCDTLIPKYLLFKTLNTNNFLDSFENYKLKIKIGNTIIIDHYLSLYSKLNTMDCIMPNNYLVKIPFESFCDKILIAALRYMNVQIFIQNADNINLETITLISGNTFETAFIETSYQDREHLQHFQQIIQDENITCNNISIESNYNLESNYNINLYGNIRGYFLEGDIEKLKNIKIIYGGNEFINYDKLMINLFSKKIHDKLIYIPLNNNFDYKECKHDNFAGSINHNLFQRIQLNLQWDSPPNALRFYGLTLSFMRTIMGMCTGLYVNRYLSQIERNSMLSDHAIRNPMVSQDEIPPRSHRDVIDLISRTTDE